MNHEYYKTPKSSWLKRLFWKAAGADRYILERCTYSDQVKYMSLGGIIIATGIMAAIAGGYAFYTIFSERGSALEHEVNLWITFKSTIFGIFWGLMIFNLDRFIVSSTGKGDGTEAITWQELKGAIPRIIMGAIIALTISKPVEIRMFKSEIDVKLYEKQLEAEANFKQLVNENYDQRIDMLDQELEKIENERSKLTNLLSSVSEKLNDIGDRTTTQYVTITDTEGNKKSIRREVPDPTISQYDKRLKDIQAQLADFDNKNKSKVDQLDKSKDELYKQKNIELSKNKIIAAGLDGLLQRIILAHEVAGFWISLFITLLFMAIELTPIFFKLMLIKSPYDYLKENIDELIKAEAGIYVEQNYYKDREGIERDLVIHTQAKRLVTDAQDIQLAQKRLNRYAIEKYEEKMRKQIDENPEAFIQTSETQDS